MKTLIALIIILLLIAGLLYVIDINNPDEGSAATTTAETIVPGVADATYTNAEYGFRLTYPSTATSSAVSFDGFLPRTGSEVASFVLPESMYAGTNLAEAGVYIGATTTLAVDECIAASESTGEMSLGTTTLSGVDFATFSASDAGAGNFYESKILRTAREGTCFEVVQMLHSGNIGNYPEGEVSQFDRAQFEGYLDGIVRTIRFDQ